MTKGDGSLSSTLVIDLQLSWDHRWSQFVQSYVDYLLSYQSYDVPKNKPLENRTESYHSFSTGLEFPISKLVHPIIELSMQQRPFLKGLNQKNISVERIWIPAAYLGWQFDFWQKKNLFLLGQAFGGFHLERTGESPAVESGFSAKLKFFAHWAFKESYLRGIFQVQRVFQDSRQASQDADKFSLGASYGFLF
ncbi:MAG: hypothetical protein HOE90_03310 [Bacteriovoracaceae bacterium]|nr:hypothetical protein [Bacteriovoracaceae bacterium]